MKDDQPFIDCVVHYFFSIISYEKGPQDDVLMGAFVPLFSLLKNVKRISKMKSLHVVWCRWWGRAERTIKKEIWTLAKSQVSSRFFLFFNFITLIYLFIFT